MTGEIIIAAIAAVGGSGVGGAVVAWIRGKPRDSAEVTQIIREMSKDALQDAKSELTDIRADLRAVKATLEELVQAVERDVIPLLTEQYPETAVHLRLISTKAREVV